MCVIEALCASGYVYVRDEDSLYYSVCMSVCMCVPVCLCVYTCLCLNT